MKTINKELPKRFENAVTKLYNAFHNGDLTYGSCSKCAVGSIVGSNEWSSVISCGNENLSDYNRVFNYMQYYGDSDRRILGLKLIQKSGYTPEHLYNVEVIFGEEVCYEESKETQFNGLCKIIEYLCELDNIPNIMDYTSLFETNEKSEPKKELMFNN